MTTRPYKPYEILPDDVLTRMLGGMLTTYYRSEHRTSARLTPLTDLNVSPRRGAPVRVAIVIVEARPAAAGQIVAAYQVVRGKTTKKTIRALASRLTKAQTALGMCATALVVPQSRFHEVRTVAPRCEVITYPG